MSKKILIVDDNPQNMKVVQMTLRPHGYTLLEATDGEEALKVVNNGAKPDLIIMDTQLIFPLVPFKAGKAAARL